MADVFDDTDDAEDLTLAQREWNKLNQDLDKDGLRDGMAAGKESGLQTGFDVGFNSSFHPFFVISSLEAIIDVLAHKLKTIDGKEDISPQLKIIKTNIKELYESVDKQLSVSDTFKTDTNIVELSEQIISLFESTKRNANKICEDFNLNQILELINNQSFLRTN